jgi:hypothetical protein
LNRNFPAVLGPVLDLRRFDLIEAVNLEKGNPLESASCQEIGPFLRHASLSGQDVGDLKVGEWTHLRTHEIAVAIERDNLYQSPSIVISLHRDVLSLEGIMVIGLYTSSRHSGKVWGYGQDTPLPEY